MKYSEVLQELNTLVNDLNGTNEICETAYRVNDIIISMEKNCCFRKCSACKDRFENEKCVINCPLLWSLEVKAVWRIIKIIKKNDKDKTVLVVHTGTGAE